MDYNNNQNKVVEVKIYLKFRNPLARINWSLDITQKILWRHVENFITYQEFSQ